MAHNSTVRLRTGVEISQLGLGPDFRIAVDANQVWDVDDAITWINQLKEFNLTWVEEPTHPDDVVGHAKIAKSIAPTLPGAGAEMYQKSIDTCSYPEGTYWKESGN